MNEILLNSPKAQAHKVTRPLSHPSRLPARRDLVASRCVLPVLAYSGESHPFDHSHSPTLTGSLFSQLCPTAARSVKTLLRAALGKA